MSLLPVRWPWKRTSGTSSAAAFISCGSYAASGDHYQQTLGAPCMAAAACSAAFIASSSWLLQQRSVQCLFTSFPSTSDGPKRCPFGRWCWQTRIQHAGSSRRASLPRLPLPQRTQFKVAISACDCIRQHSPAYFNNVCILVASISIVGQIFVRQNATTCLSLRQEHNSVDGVSTLQLAAPTVWNALPPHLCSSSVSRGRGQFRAGFTQAYGHLWELLLKSVLFYIYIYITLAKGQRTHRI